MTLKNLKHQTSKLGDHVVIQIVIEGKIYNVKELDLYNDKLYIRAESEAKTETH